MILVLGDSRFSPIADFCWFRFSKNVNGKPIANKTNVLYTEGLHTLAFIGTLGVAFCWFIVLYKQHLNLIQGIHGTLLSQSFNKCTSYDMLYSQVHRCVLSLLPKIWWSVQAFKTQCLDVHISLIIGLHHFLEYVGPWNIEFYPKTVILGYSEVVGIIWFTSLYPK